MRNDDRSVFRRGNLDDCEVQGATLRETLFEGVSMVGADFSGSDLGFSEFYMVFALGALFKGSSMRHVRIQGGSFRDADFSSADLSGAIFEADNMGGYVDLRGADFSLCLMDDVFLDKVIYDKNTQLPDGIALGESCERRDEDL